MVKQSCSLAGHEGIWASGGFGPPAFNLGIEKDKWPALRSGRFSHVEFLVTIK